MNNQSFSIQALIPSLERCFPQDAAHLEQIRKLYSEEPKKGIEQLKSFLGKKIRLLQSYPANAKNSSNIQILQTLQKKIIDKTNPWYTKLGKTVWNIGEKMATVEVLDKAINIGLEVVNYVTESTFAIPLPVKEIKTTCRFLIPFLIKPTEKVVRAVFGKGKKLAASIWTRLSTALREKQTISY